MRIRFIAWLPLALVAALHMAPARGQSVDVTINFVPTGVADWNVASNWSTVPDNLQFIPGDNFPREVASISNGGTAFINTATQFPIDGLLLGDGPGTNGTLELRSGGSLTVVDAAELEAGRDGGVFVGVDGRGSLLLNGGALNADFLIVGGASSSRVEARGSATVNISGDAILTRSFKTVGPNVNFNVGGNLVVTDRFEAEITGAAHAALKVPNGTATFGAPELSLRFTGVAPAFGNSWTLIDAQQIVGAFGPVSVVGTELPRGLVVTPDFDEAAGKLNVVVDNRLILKVDRKTGGTSIENAAGTPITIDGYTIASPGGHLLSTNARWSSLDDQNLAAFQEAAPTPNFLSELSPTSSLAFNVGGTRALGTPYSYTPSAFGVSGDDIVFEYTSPTGEIETGIVEYSGGINNLVLTVDPTTGKGVLQNQSPFTIAIDGYTIGSASSSLTPATWTSLDDQNIATWAEANPAVDGLSELLPVGGFTITPNASFNLGNLFKTTGERDLSLTFTMSNGTLFDGVVVYGKAATGQPGDTNADGVVNLVDLNNVRNNFGGAGLGDTDGDSDVDLDDLNAVRNNFGAGGSATAVPEPASVALCGIAALTLLAWRRRK